MNKPDAPHIACFAMCGFFGTTGMLRDRNQTALLGVLNDWSQRYRNR